MSIILPELPFTSSALAPIISEKTLEFHYGKHHYAYVTNLNKLIVDSDLAEESLENIILKTVGIDTKMGIFNNAAQVWNHTFYWNSIRPGGGGMPTGAIADKIDKDFGGYEKFVEAFKNAGMTQFGSGWAWLLLENGKLKISNTLNADTPIAHGQKPVLTIDVWEHAYYLDFQNRRPDYLSEIIKSLLNWDFANKNMS